MYIKDRNINPESSYNLILGKEIGSLISQVHSAAIGSGYVLENTIEEFIYDDRVQFTTKIFDVDGENIIPDMFFDEGLDVMEWQNTDLPIHIGEFKLGTTFDTKKSKAEITNLLKLQKHFEKKGRKVKLYFMSFLAEDHETIEVGVKGKLHEDIIPLTGKELADWLGFDFQSVKDRLSSDINRNQKYLFEQLAEVMGYDITG